LCPTENYFGPREETFWTTLTNVIHIIKWRGNKGNTGVKVPENYKQTNKQIETNKQENKIQKYGSRITYHAWGNEKSIKISSET
jgi:hypothetical protein